MTPAARSTAIAVLAAAAIYAAFHFAILGLPVIGTPIFRIDYVMTTVARGNDLGDIAFALYRARPVSEGWIMVQSFLGRVLLGGEVRYFAYAVQHLSILAYFFMVAHALDHVFRARLHRLAVIAAWLMFLQCEGVIEAVYKLESFVGTVSMLFGGLSLVALAQWDRTRGRWAFAAAVAAFAASLFAKEDFLVPPLLLLGWFAVRDGMRGKVKRLAPMAIALGLVVVAFLVFNRVILPGRSFIESESHVASVYFMSFSPASMIRTGWAYATRGEIETMVFAAWLLVSLLAFALRLRWKEALWLGLVVGGLMGPYVIMPNHQFALYSVKWLPWQLLGGAMLLQCLAAERFCRARLATIATTVGAVGMFALTLWGIEAHTARTWHASRYLVGNYATARNLQASLVRDRAALNALDEVAVLGVGRGGVWLSPWHDGGETAFWFGEDLGLHPRWVLYVERPDASYPIGTEENGVRIRGIADIGRDKPSHAYVVSKDGNARLVDLRGKDAAAFAANRDLIAFSRWTADARYRVDASPQVLPDCEGTHAKVGLTWDFSALGKDLEIFVKGPRGERVLWARTHATGNGETGAWAKPGMQVEFVEAGKAQPIARLVIGESRCTTP